MSERMSEAELIAAEGAVEGALCMDDCAIYPAEVVRQKAEHALVRRLIPEVRRLRALIVDFAPNVPRDCGLSVSPLCSSGQALTPAEMLEAEARAIREEQGLT